MEKNAMRRFKLALVLLTLLAMVIFGTVAQAQQKSVTLVARTHDQLYLDYFKSREPEWEAAHPDIKFTYDFQVDPNVAQDTLNTLASGGQPPDLIGIERGSFGMFMKDGAIAKYFVDLSPLIGDAVKNYSAGRWSIYSYKGDIYGIES